MNRDELKGKKVRELMKLATSLGIRGAWTMKKEDLINEIAAVTAVTSPVEEIDDKNKRIQNAPLGTIVAFNAPGGRVRSAKIELRSTVNKRLKVVTEYGASYNISYDDVIWVKSGKRWPKGVYNLLKRRIADGQTC